MRQKKNMMCSDRRKLIIFYCYVLRSSSLLHKELFLTGTLLPGTTGAARESPDLVGLGTASTARVSQDLGTVLVVRAFDVYAEASRLVLDVARGRDRPVL